jgi:hypothetical protein
MLITFQNVAYTGILQINIVASSAMQFLSTNSQISVLKEGNVIKNHPLEYIMYYDGPEFSGFIYVIIGNITKSS